MSDPNNVDGTLVQVMHQQMNGQAPVQAAADIPAPPPVEQPQEQSPEPVSQQQEPEIKNDPVEPEVSRRTSEPEKAEDNPIDEYGNPVEKPRVYTEEEVNRMMRERLSRGRHYDQQPQGQQPFQQQQQPSTEQGGEDWERELKQYIKSTLKEATQEEQERHWQQEEAKRQIEFQEKFSSGMRKYNDFEQVISGKPITNGVMLAARALDNPAAFIYGAAKMHPQELDRIARINDPYVQAAEVGRLHERMVKERRMVSGAAKPLETPKGDVPQKAYNPPSLESRIEAYGRQRRK